MTRRATPKNSMNADNERIGAGPSDGTGARDSGSGRAGVVGLARDRLNLGGG